MQPEDVDAVLGRRRDEAPGELAVDRPGADEEAPAQREPERRLDPRLDRADPLPRALDAAADRAVEDAAAGDLEVGEPGSVEDLGEPEQLGGRHRSRERVLPEQANRRVDQLRHARDLIAAVKRARPRSTAGGPSSCAAGSRHSDQLVHDEGPERELVGRGRAPRGPAAAGERRCSTYAEREVRRGRCPVRPVVRARGDVDFRDDRSVEAVQPRQAQRERPELQQRLEVGAVVHLGARRGRSARGTATIPGMSSSSACRRIASCLMLRRRNDQPTLGETTTGRPGNSSKNDSSGSVRARNDDHASSKLVNHSPTR